MQTHYEDRDEHPDCEGLAIDESANDAAWDGLVTGLLIGVGFSVLAGATWTLLH